jgi:hypothetical protein
VTSVLFLLVAVGLSVVGCSLLLLAHRKPTSLEHGIDTFRAEMRALAPDRAAVAPRRRRARSSASPAAPRGGR